MLKHLLRFSFLLLLSTGIAYALHVLHLQADLFTGCYAAYQFCL